MQTNNKREMFETMPVPKALLSMAIPTIITQLINLVYNLADTFFIGRTGNPYMVAGVSISFTLFMLTVAFANVFGIGGGSLMSRLIGNREDAKAKNVCAYSFYFAITVAATYSLIVLVSRDPLLRLLGASEVTIKYARQYANIVVICGNIPIILSVTEAHLLRNIGYSKQASAGLSLGGILNIILDPLFMFVLFPSGSEVIGAALATLISYIISCVFLTVMLYRLSGESSASISFADARKIKRTDIKNLYSVGIPSGFLSVLFDLANIVLNSQMAIHGDLAVAALGIVMKIERLPNALCLGLSQGMLPIVAYNYSSGNIKRMKNVMNTTRLWGVIICMCTITFFELSATFLVKLFLSTGNDANAVLQTIKFGTVFLRIRCIASLGQFMNYHSSFCMQAMGNGRGTLVHACIRELGFYIPSMFVLNKLVGIYGLASSLLVGEYCGAIAALIILRLWLKKQSI